MELPSARIVTASQIDERGAARRDDSHSMVQGYDNALIYQRKFFGPTAKNRPAGPSKIRALEFKREFRRFEFSPVSATIDNDRSIFLKTPMTRASPAALKKDRQHGTSKTSSTPKRLRVVPPGTIRSSPFITRPATLTHHSDTSIGFSWMPSALGMIRNHAAAKTRMLLPFEAIQAAFKLIDSLSDREHVVADRIVDAFQRFGEARNLGP